MGRPEANPSVPQTDQTPTLHYELQHQEYQFELTHETLTDQNHPQQQSQPQPTVSTPANDPLLPQIHGQQQLLPQPSPPQPYTPPPVPQQYPPQVVNQGYGAHHQAAPPVQFPPQTSQTFPGHQQQPAGLQQNPMYTNYELNHSAVYFPQGSRTIQAQQSFGGYTHNTAQANLHLNSAPQPQPYDQFAAYNYAPLPVQYSNQNITQVTYVGVPPWQAPAPDVVVTGMIVNRPLEGWRTGLFDCFDDPFNALLTLFFPCVTFGQVAEIVDDGRTSCGVSAILYSLIVLFIGLPCIISCTYRTKLRNKFGLIEDSASDWLTHLLCEYCALCQEYRELQLRGWEPSLGWHGNLRNQSMQQQQTAMMPPANQRMMA